MTAPFHRVRTDRQDSPSKPAPMFCIVGETVCRVRIWTDAEWELLDIADRPTVVEQVPGLGWVGAVLSRDVN
ncbi:hypothetical protein ACYOEI_13180 [Singulisphaera rosea]